MVRLLETQVKFDAYYKLTSIYVLRIDKIYLVGSGFFMHDLNVIDHCKPRFCDCEGDFFYL